MKKLGCCVICQKSESKYCCPKCSTSTCSMVCSREHKKKNACDGKRDPVKFVSLKAFDDLTMLSDYRLLESAGRVVEACARDPMKRYTRYKEELPKHLKYLRNAIYQRGCRLKYLPQHFQRHSQNTTYLNWQTRVLKWKVEWNFDQAGLQKITESLSESALLGATVCSLIEDPELIYYKSAGIRNMKILIVAEEQKGKRKRYYECDPSQTLRGNLMGLTIIEYPRIHVVLANHIQAYKVIPRGEDDDIDLGIQGIVDSEPSASEASDSDDSSSLDEESEDGEKSSNPRRGNDERIVPELQLERKRAEAFEVNSHQKRTDKEAFESNVLQNRREEESLQSSSLQEKGEENFVPDLLSKSTEQSRKQMDLQLKPQHKRWPELDLPETPPKKRKEDNSVTESPFKKRQVEDLCPKPQREDELLQECDIKKEPEYEPVVKIPLVEIKIEKSDHEMADNSMMSRGILENLECSLVVPKVEKEEPTPDKSSDCVSNRNHEFNDKEHSSQMPEVTESIPLVEASNEGAEVNMEVPSLEDADNSVVLASPPPGIALVCYDVSDSD